jgi:hypothetical protein
VLGEIALERLDPQFGLSECSCVRARLLPCRAPQPGERAVVPGSSPPDDVARIEALPAQQCSLVAVTGTAVVLRDDRKLVLGDKGSPSRFDGKCGNVIARRFILGALHQKGWHGHRGLPDPVSPLRNGLPQQVSQVMLTEREVRIPTTNLHSLPLHAHAVSAGSCSMIGNRYAGSNRRHSRRCIGSAVTATLYGCFDAATTSDHWPGSCPCTREVGLGGGIPEGITCPTETPGSRWARDRASPRGRDNRTWLTSIDHGPSWNYPRRTPSRPMRG